MFCVTAELDIRPTPDTADRVVGQLEGYSPAAAPSEWGFLEVVISILADDIAQAARIGVAVLEQETGLRVRTIEVMTTGDYDRRDGIEPLPVVMGVPSAAATLGISPQAVHGLIESGALPATRADRAWVLPASAVLKRASRLARERGAVGGAG
jgi:hypothetical protein